ncbi:CACTA en-spm transposon protein [Cucumis melo var. makuwa]|uniref:CACTA en-spm transposon protein n=1 Tax=Cucumis melo var. makuwa TaxID=1194695 RepID=A0A5A7UWM4_CUCMM|nr:CACTA en-spm transposon protein [Cucumis melo var. makuwa]
MTSTNYRNIPHCTEWCIMESQLALEEEETKEGRLKDEMSRNIGVDIDEDTTNIFQDLLNETRNELYVLIIYSAGASQPSVTTTPSRRVQSRLLELKLYIAANRRILMIIAPNAEKPISPYIICFSQAIGKCEQSRTNKDVRQKQPYNHNNRTFVSQSAKDAHSQPTLEGTQPLSGDKICDTSTVELQLRAPLDQAMQQIEEQTRNHDALASEVERMRKLIEDMSRALQGPPHDP